MKPITKRFFFSFSGTYQCNMRLFSILKKPNQLDKLAEDTREERGILNNVRLQVKILHSLGICYVISFCLSVNFASVFLGLPAVFAQSSTKLFYAQCLMWWICFNIISNYLLIIYQAKKSHFGQGNSKDLPFDAVNKTAKPDWSAYDNLGVNGGNKSDWSKCSHCDILVPPRTRHCAICKVCVLKKDHHCFFVGNCIGFYNQKHFIIFCVYGIIGGSWGLFNLGTYLSQTYAPIFSFNIYQYLLPYCVLKFFLGYLSFFTMCLIVLFYLHVTSTCASLYYFTWQMFIISRGQTSYELVKRKRIYSDDLGENLGTVFGKYWLLPFLIPIPMPLNEGDGMNWTKKWKSS